MKIALAVILLTVLTNSLYAKASKILFIDTAGANPYCYDSFIAIAKQHGLEIDIKPFYELPAEPTWLDQYSGVILSLDGLFLRKLALDLQTEKTVKHPLVRSALETVTQLSKKNNMLIGILLPSVNNHVAVYSLMQFLLHQWHFYDEQTKQLIEPILRLTLSQMLTGDAQKSCGYHTSLLCRKTDALEKNKNDFNITLTDPKTGNLIAQTLPLPHSALQQNQFLKNLIPTALYMCNPSINNHYFIAKNSFITFGDIQENFLLNPIDTSLRQELFNELQNNIQFIAKQMNSQNGLKVSVSESNSSHLEQKMNGIPIEPSKSILGKMNKLLQYLKNKWWNTENIPLSASNISGNEMITLACHYDWTQQGIWCGWTGLDAYKDKELQAAEHILKTGLNLIWIELNPEWYLSIHGIKKDQKEAFLQRINTFTQALQQKSKELNQPIPKIFIGTDITSNFAQQKVQNIATDVFGNTYTKIPSPLDYANLWRTELIDVLTHFITQWQRIGNGVPIAGIFLDLEMYHAQDQTGQYLPLMDFSDLSWQFYCNKQNDAQAATARSLEDRVRYLHTNKLFAQYFQILSSGAKDIGKSIKQYIKQVLPEAIVAVYNLTLPSNWFYCGFLSGLSTPKEPIIYASFNNEYQRHKQWLNNKNVYLLHLPVMLLSKIRTIPDFNLIDTLSNNHDGIWFNRIERLEQSRNSTDWPYDFGLEVTPLETDIFIENLNKTIKKGQKSSHF